MKLPVLIRKSTLILAGSIAGVLRIQSALAGDGTWNASPTNGIWEAAGAENNWSTGAGTFPGALNSLNNADTATFLTSSVTSISINSTAGNSSPLGIKGITFGAVASPSAFTIGNTSGNALWLASGGSISIASGSTVAGATETVNAPLVLQSASAATAGAYSFSNASSLTGSILRIGGTVTGGTTTQGVTLTLTGANSSANEVSGVISDGGAAAGVAISKTSTGIWNLNAANTYTAGTTVTGGTLGTTLSGASGTPFGTGSISLSGAGGATSTQTTLSITPSATGATTLTAGTAAGSQLSFSNTAFINLVRKDASSPLTFSFGSGSGSVLNRVGRGALVFTDNTTGLPTALGVSGGNNFLVNGTTPTVTNGMVAAYFLGARSGGTGQGIFLTYDNTFGFKNVTYDITGTSLAASDSTKKVSLTGTPTIASDAAAYAVAINGATTLNSGVTLTIGDNGTTPAGLILNNSLSGGTVAFGASEGIIYTSGNVTMSSAITGTGGITKTQYNGTNGALTLSGLNSYSGTTTVTTGTLNFSNAGNQNLGALDGPGTIINVAGSGTLTFNQASGGLYSIGTLTNSTTSGASGAVTLNSGAGATTTIGTLSGASGSQVFFAGAASSTTTIAGRLNTPGQLVNVTGGTLILGGTGSSNGLTTNNLQVDGGTLTSSGDRLAMENNTLNVNGGQIFIASTSSFGLRLNGINGVNGVASNTTGTFTGTQTGGSVNIFKGGAALSFNLGSTSATTSTYNLQGGTLNAFGDGTNAGTGGFVQLGADTGGVGKTTFNFSGGKLIASGQVSGNQGTAARQAFVWTGGTLATGAFIATNLTSTDGAAFAGNVGTLNNTGTGILAPGDIAQAGLTAITGNYVQGASATLAVDLGGTTVASGFQSGTNTFDRVTVSGTSNLNGTLTVNVLPGYRPTGSFTVLSSTGALTASGGSFNSATPQTIATNEGFATMTATTTVGAGGTVVLSGYTITNQWASGATTWSDADGNNSWANNTGTANTGTDPNASTVGALFVLSPSTISLVNNRTVRNVTFAPATSAFTIAAGGGTLTLDGGTSFAVINNAVGNNAINAPIALNTTTYAGSASGTTLTLGGALSGSGALNTSGAVILSGNNSSYTGAISVGDAPASTLNPSLTLNNSNALGGATSVTVNGTTSGTTTRGTSLALANGVTITGKTLTMAPLGQRSTLHAPSGSTASWAGDIAITTFIGSSGGVFAWADGSLTVGASTSNTVQSSGLSFGIRGGGTGILNSTLNLGTGGLTKTDGGTWTINSNSNAYSGSTTISAGTVVVSTISNTGVISALGSGGTINLGQNQVTNNVGTLRFTGTSGGSSNRVVNISNGANGGGGVLENTVSGQTLTFSGGLTTSTPASAASLTLQGAGNGVLSGGISGAPLLSITKSGLGTWTLGGANTHTGNTTVNGGTLLVSGSLTGSAATVSNAGSTLGGTGTVGAVTVGASAALQGGDGASASGQLSSAGNVTLNDNSVIKLTLGGSGAHSSLARTGGTWAFDLNQAFTFTGVAEVGTYDNLITGLTGSETGIASIGTWLMTNPGYVGTFSFDGSNVDLTLTAVPEPGSVASLVGGLAVLCSLQRRRRSRPPGSV